MIKVSRLSVVDVTRAPGVLRFQRKQHRFIRSLPQGRVPPESVAVRGRDVGARAQHHCLVAVYSSHTLDMAYRSYAEGIKNATVSAPVPNKGSSLTACPRTSPRKL